MKFSPSAVTVGSWIFIKTHLLQDLNVTGKRPLGRSTCRREDNIKMNLQEVGCGDTACRHVDMPLHTIQHAKRMNVCCRITTLEDSNFNQ
jgi:hypothetical protein